MEKRVQVLEEYELLDTLPESEFDDIVELASVFFHTPISLISLLDSHRQWFKARVGLDATETPIEYAFCFHAIQRPGEVMVVPDSWLDNRFKDNPLATGAPHVRFYAGAPLVTNDGYALGTLCVIDKQPREFSDELGKEKLSDQEIKECLPYLKASTDELDSYIHELNRSYKIRRSRSEISMRTKGGVVIRVVSF